MEPKRVIAAYFSGTGTTKKTVLRIARELAAHFAVPVKDASFTLPRERQEELSCTPEDLVVVGVPTYAGRVPNLLLPYLREKLIGGGALAVPVVLFGNRNYDDSLKELRNILEEVGFCTVAAAAFVGEHSFSTTLGAGRPHAADLAQMDEFARRTAQKIRGLTASAPAAPVDLGDDSPVRPYYTPRDRSGSPINILKVKPKTDMAKCGSCGWCAAHCPMGSIDPADPAQVTGVCIKCCACVKGCPTGAKYYDDPGYLYHKSELEAMYERPAENALFL